MPLKREVFYEAIIKNMTKIHKILLWILAVVSIFGLGTSGVKVMGGSYHNPQQINSSTTTYSGILPIVQGGLATSTAPGTGQILVGNGGTYTFVTGVTKVNGGACTSTFVSGILTTTTCP